MDDAGEGFWDYSCRVYVSPEVAASCLELQDVYGLDVNLVLFAAWTASCGIALDAATASAARKVSRDWQEPVVAPVRAARRAMKGWIAEPGLGEIVAGRRRELAALELALEEIEQRLLARLVTVGQPAAASLPLCSNLEIIYHELNLPDGVLRHFAESLGLEDY